MCNLYKKASEKSTTKVRNNDRNSTFDTFHLVKYFVNIILTKTGNESIFSFIETFCRTKGSDKYRF